MPLISPCVSPVRGSSEGVSERQRNTSAPASPGRVYRNHRRRGTRAIVRPPRRGGASGTAARSRGTVSWSTRRIVLRTAPAGHPFRSGIAGRAGGRDEGKDLRVRARLHGRSGAVVLAGGLAV